VVSQGDGKIIVYGSTGDEFALVRYNTDAGVVDTGFGPNKGLVTSHFAPDSSASVSDVAIQPDGKILAVGSSYPGGSYAGDFALARFDANGNPDPMFGGGTGQVTTDFGQDEWLGGVALQSDGRIVVAGGTSDDYLDFSNPTPTTQFALARYNVDGSPDPTFGTDGLVTAAFLPSDNAFASSVFL
jgi:uncharacterized delta-60 repeat protein